jgi:hypothetical protein
MLQESHFAVLSTSSSLVGIAAGRTVRVLNPNGVSDFFLQNVKTGSVAQPADYLVGNEVLSQG